MALDLDIVAVQKDRCTADATRVEHTRRGTPACGYGGPRAAELGTGAPAAALERCGGASRGVEDLASFHEEQALVREIGLPCGEVDHGIIGLDRSEVRQCCGRDLETGRRSPEHVHAGTPVVVIVAVVQRRGGIGKEVELPFGRHVGYVHRLERGHESRAAGWQGGPTPAFVAVGDPARSVETHLPFAVRGRHRHHRPRQKQFGAPTVREFRRRAIPRSVPFLRVVALRQDLSVPDGAAQRDGEPIAVKSLAGRIQRDRPRVATDVVVPGRQPGDQRLGRLFVPDADVETPVGVQEPRNGAETGRPQRFGLHHDHVVVAGNLLPDGFVKLSVDGDVDGVVARHQDSFVGVCRSKLASRHGSRFGIHETPIGRGGVGGRGLRVKRHL